MRILSVIPPLLFAICLAAVSRAESPPPFLLAWGSLGSGDGQFYTPYDAAVDREGNVYVADRRNNRIQKFTGQGVFLTKWGTWGTGPGQFWDPVAVIVDAGGNVYVSDYQNNRIQKFTSDGVFLRAWGSSGTGDGEFNGPHDAAAFHDTLFVVDMGNDRIQKFSLDGTYLGQWGSPGPGSGELDFPLGVDVDATGNLYVSEFLNHRVQKFTSTGVSLAMWGEHGSADGQFDTPDGLAVDARGNVYVADTNNQRIQKFSGDGQFLTKWGSYGTGNGEFDMPIGVTAGPGGRIYVADYYNHRIQAFGFSSGPTPPGSNVVVLPVDPVSGTSPVTVVFDQVTAAGITSLAIGTTGSPPPAGFRLGNPPIYFELSTTATYVGPIRVCIDYSGIQFGKEEKAKLFHVEEGRWWDRTVSLDTTANTICAVVPSLSAFAAFEESPVSVIAGRVGVDCAPGSGLGGVVIDAYSVGDGSLAAWGETDGNGDYLLPALYSGTYMVTIVTPLGYRTSPEEVEVVLPPGGAVALDYSLACLPTPAAPRSVGFWKHQVGVATGGNGRAEIDAGSLCGYLDGIQAHFNSNRLNPVQVYDPPASGECGGPGGKLAVAGDLLNLKGSTAMIDRARQQLMALLLNVAAGKLGLTAAISADHATVSQAITCCDNLIDEPSGNHERAKDIADRINNGLLVPAGWIPLDTRFIAYAPGSRGGGPSGALRVSPNPATAWRTITFGVSVPGPVRVDVYDIAGRRVAAAFDGYVEDGLHDVRWDGRTDSGDRLPDGLYLVRLVSPDGTRNARMLQVGVTGR